MGVVGIEQEANVCQCVLDLSLSKETHLINEEVIDTNQQPLLMYQKEAAEGR